MDVSLCVCLSISPAQSAHRAGLLASEQRLRALRRELNAELSDEWSEQADCHTEQVNAILARFGQPVPLRPSTRAAPLQQQQTQPLNAAQANSRRDEARHDDDEDDVQLPDEDEDEDEEGKEEEEEEAEDGSEEKKQKDGRNERRIQLQQQQQQYEAAMLNVVKAE